MPFSITKKFFQRRLVGALFAVATVALTVLLYDTNVVQEILGTSIFPALERRGFDVLMRVRGTRAHSEDIVLIKIDDYTDRQLGWPIRRDHYGAVMTLLSNAGAKAVALDMLLPKKQEGGDSTENALMVQYLQQAAGTFQVIGPFIPSRTSRELVSRRDVDSTAHFIIGRFGVPAPRRHHFFRSPFINDYPFPELADVSTGVGHALIIPDTLDGVIRSMPLFVEYAGRLYPSLGMALAMHSLHIPLQQLRFEDTDDGTIVRAGQREFPTGEWGDLLINYVGRSDVFPTVSFVDVLLAARDRNEQFFTQFKDKVCIIGPTIRSVGDYYSTPVDESSPGYVTHANVYDMIVTDSLIHPAPLWIHYVLLLLVTLAVGLAAHTKRMRTGVLILAAVTVAYAVFAVISFSAFNIWFKAVQTLFALIACFVGVISYRAATEGRQRKIITDMFGRYVDSTVVQILIDNPSLVKLGGEKKEITILFTDIKGFSTISERVSDEVLVKLLNVYLTEMTNVILKNHGTVDKFIGDAIMAFWGAPLSDDEAPYHACLSALEMQSRLDRLQPKLRKIGNVEIHQRVGVNTGLCTVGNMGSELKLNYTAIGDPVNLASRLEGANKQFGTGVLISEYTYEKVARRVLTREVDRVIVMGKSEPVRVYELMDTADKTVPEKVKTFLEVYAEGIQAYQQRKWDEGIALMEHAMTFVPDDPVCQMYIERMKLYQLTPPDADWKGVFVLHSK